MKVIIHTTGIRWQQRYFELLRKGFRIHGITDVHKVSTDTPTAGDLHVLLGPNYWKKCEFKYDNYLQVNRKFIGDVDDDVAISWNGFNGKGIFCVDEIAQGQLDWCMERSPIKIYPWRELTATPHNFLLLGQADVGRSMLYSRLSSWYEQMRTHYKHGNAVFRQHPKGDGHTLEQDVARTGFSVSLNSTVAVETLMLGHPTVVHDPGSPVWSICNPECLPAHEEPNRQALFEYLAMGQYHCSDIEFGVFWEQLNPKRGPRLCDVTF